MYVQLCMYERQPQLKFPIATIPQISKSGYKLQFLVPQSR